MSHFLEPSGVVNVYHESIVKDKESYPISIKKQKSYNFKIPNVIYFEPPHNKIVISTTRNRTVRIYDSETLDLIKSIKDNTGWVYQVVRYRDSFLSCTGSDKSVRCYSIMEPFNLLKLFRFDSYVIQLLKLNEFLFLCKLEDDFVIFNYENEAAELRFTIGKTSDEKPVKSIKFPNCFYLSQNSSSESSSIKMINFEKYKIEKSFPRDTPARYFYKTFQSSRGDEIILVCEELSKFYFFNTSYDEFNVNKALSENANLLTKHSSTVENSTCVSVFSNQFVFSGNRRGMISIFEIMENSNSLKVIGEENLQVNKKESKTPSFFVQTNRMNCILIIPSSNSKSNGCLRFCVSSSSLMICSIDGLKFHDSQSEIDEKERISYILEKKDEYIVDLGNETLVGVKFFNIQFRDIPKILFL